MHLAMPIAWPNLCPVIVAPLATDARMSFGGTGAGLDEVNPAVAGFATVEVRGTGWTSIGVGLEWTLRRAMPTIGQTLYERRIFDLLAAIRVLRKQPGIGPIATFGRGNDAALAIYAALLDPLVTECVVQHPVTTHWNRGPELLNVLKIGDLPDNAALLLPRTMSFIGAVPKAYAQMHCVASRRGATDAFPAQCADAPRVEATCVGHGPGSFAPAHVVWAG